MHVGPVSASIRGRRHYSTASVSANKLKSFAVIRES